MKTYTHFYKQGLNYFAEDYEKALSVLSKKESLAFCSALGNGDGRFLNYVAYRLSLDTDYHVFTLTPDEESKQEIATEIKGLSRGADGEAKQVVIIAPRFDLDVEGQGKYLLNLKTKYSEGNIQTIIALPWQFHANPAGFSDYATLLPQVVVRRVFTLADTTEQIKVREQLHDWNIAEVDVKEVHELAGGISKLIKRILSRADKGESIEVEELLKDQAVLTILAAFAEMYDALSFPVLQQMGLIDESGKTTGTLLSKHLSDQKIAPKSELTDSQRDLFNLLYQNRNKLVTDEMIDKAMRRGKVASPWANYKAVQRLRNQLGSTFRIRTVKGRGYVLSELA